jgi:hypothetical protein
MADELVKVLNGYGLQPVFLPQTGIAPPQVYTYVNGKLVRVGPLAKFIKAAAKLKPSPGKVPDIKHQYTSDKNLEGAVSLLKNALSCLGIGQAPKLNLSFAGAKKFHFAFSGVTTSGVDPADFIPLLGNAAEDVFKGVPRQRIQQGKLHIAYEYAYAEKLLLERADGLKFEQDISGQVDQFFDVGVKCKVSVQRATSLSFENTSGAAAAFAYRAGQLKYADDSGWEFYPEEVLLSARGVSAKQRRQFVPQRGVVLAER